MVYQTDFPKEDAEISWKRKRRRILLANKTKKFVKEKNPNDRCNVCGKELRHHHWLCDKCYEKRNKGKWVTFKR